MAAQIAALDLVISAGNANVHFAGGLGIPAWALLPVCGGWRWLASRDTALWYGSVRLIRQTACGRWDDVLQRAQSDLVKFAESSGR